MDSNPTRAHPDRLPDGDGDVVSLLALASFSLRHRGLILASTTVCVLFALAGALRTQLRYTASASFIPNGAGQGGGLGRLSQQLALGVSTVSGEIRRTPAFYQDLLESRAILSGLLESPIDVVTVDGVRTVDLVEHFGIPGATAELRFESTRRRLEGVIGVEFSRETGVVTVTARTSESALSAAIVSRLMDLIVAFDVETRQSQAAAERRFAGERLEQLREELSTAEDSLKSFLDENRQFSNSPQLTFEHDRMQRGVAMRHALVTSMAQSYERARIDEVRSTPILTVIDHPVAPAIPDPRGRRRRLIAGLVLGLVVGVGMGAARELLGRALNGEGDDYQELREALKDVRKDLFGLRGGSRPSPDSAGTGA